MLGPNTANLVLTLFIALFIVNGLIQGLIHMIGSIVGLVIGVTLASSMDTAVGAWISAATGWNKSVTVVLAFILVLIIFTRLFGWLIALLERSFKILKAPVIGIVNRVGGAALGFIEGILIIGSTLILARQLPFPEIVKSIDGAAVAVGLVSAAKILLPLLPKAVRSIYEGNPAP